MIACAVTLPVELVVFGRTKFVCRGLLLVASGTGTTVSVKVRVTAESVESGSAQVPKARRDRVVRVLCRAFIVVNM